MLLGLLCVSAASRLAARGTAFAAPAQRLARHSAQPPCCLRMRATSAEPPDAGSSLAELRAFIADNGLDIKTSGPGRTKQAILSDILGGAPAEPTRAVPAPRERASAPRPCLDDMPITGARWACPPHPDPTVQTRVDLASLSRRSRVVPPRDPRI